MVMKRKSPMKKQSMKSRGKESEGTMIFDEGRMVMRKKKAKKKSGKKKMKKQSAFSRGKESEGTKLSDMGRMRKR